jgi:hypothetical protein
MTDTEYAPTAQADSREAGRDLVPRAKSGDRKLGIRPYATAGASGRLLRLR